MNKGPLEPRALEKSKNPSAGQNNFSVENNPILNVSGNRAYIDTA